MTRLARCALLCTLLPACDRTPAVSPAPDAPQSAVHVPSATPTSSAVPTPTTPPGPPSLPGPGKAASKDGSIELLTQPIYAIHTHGGDEAKIGRFTLTVKNSAARERTLTLAKMEYRTGHSCDKPPTDVRARPKPQLLVPDDDHDPRPPSTSAVIPAKGELKLSAQFDSVGAYYTHCDQFALVATFVLDQTESIAVGVAIHIEREEP